jgi:ribosomal protein S13
MFMSRNVIVVSPRSNQPIKVSDFTGSTWGELRNHPQVYSHVEENVEAVLRQGNVTLSREDAQLPEGDVHVFLVPTKNKSGMSEEQAKEIGQQITEAIVKAAALSSEEDVRKLKERLIEDVADFFNVNEDDLTSTSNNEESPASELSEEDQRLMDEYNQNYRR